MAIIAIIKQTTLKNVILIYFDLFLVNDNYAKIIQFFFFSSIGWSLVIPINMRVQKYYI